VSCISAIQASQVTYPHPTTTLSAAKVIVIEFWTHKALLHIFRNTICFNPLTAKHGATDMQKLWNLWSSVHRIRSIHLENKMLCIVVLSLNICYELHATENQTSDKLYHGRPSTTFLMVQLDILKLMTSLQTLKYM
jgi:hypothetical protein